MRELAAANPQLDDPDRLVPGLVIRIPNPLIRRYVIQPGDTFYEIARRFDIGLQDLQKANPGVRPDRLCVGQCIVLPSSWGMSIVQSTAAYGFAELADDLAMLTERYPFLEVAVIGKSVLGQNLYAVKLGAGPNRVQYNGAIHANEWITSLLLMKFVEEYSAAYAAGTALRGCSIRELYQKTSLWIVPMVNPDGVELVQEGPVSWHPYCRRLLEWNNGSCDFSRWKANIRGVDLNDQFPAHWEEEKARRDAAGPGPRDYAGTAPLTEPEARALAAFTRSIDFSLVIAFHTQGREIYYNYRDLEPPGSKDIAHRFASVSGYRPVRLTGSDAGFKDWFIQDFRRYGFTVEAGIGVNPLPLSQFPCIYEETAGIMLEGISL
jgi:g-D-glutamyl-meso-diaminopimelate peptidase